MSNMSDFVEENLDILDDLPVGCTRNLMTEDIWRAELTLAVDEVEGIFSVLRFQIEDTGAKFFMATLTSQQWHPDRGIIGKQNLHAGDVASMTSALKKAMKSALFDSDAADSDEARHFLRFVEIARAEFTESIDI